MGGGAGHCAHPELAKLLKVNSGSYSPPPVGLTHQNRAEVVAGCTGFNFHYFSGHGEQYPWTGRKKAMDRKEKGKGDSTVFSDRLCEFVMVGPLLTSAGESVMTLRNPDVVSISKLLSG